MSLIDDALKRAQAAQDTTRERTDRPWTPPPLPDPGRIARARARWIFAAVAVAGLLGAALLLRPARSAKPVLPRSPAARVPAPTSALPAITSEVSVGPPPRGIASEQPPLDARIPATSRSAVSEGSRAAPSIPATEAPLVSHRTQTVESRPPSSSGEPRSYVGELPLPGGARITLDGIVFSDTSPVAVLNGRVLAPGGFIEGYTVSQIQPDRVELERDGIRVLVKLR